MKKITLLDIKDVLKDKRFRDALAPELKPDLLKYLSNPSCTCNVPFYRKVLKDHRPLLISFFPDAEIEDEAVEVARKAENHWRVINCLVTELEAELKKLPPGRKQVAVTRFEDKVTVVVNELDVLY